MSRSKSPARRANLTGALQYTLLAATLSVAGLPSGASAQDSAVPTPTPTPATPAAAPAEQPKASTFMVPAPGVGNTLAVTIPEPTSRWAQVSESAVPTHGGPAAAIDRLKQSGLTVDQIATTYTLRLSEGNMRVVSLRDVVLSTLANNLGIRISRLDEGISRDEIEIEKGIYDPMVSSRLSRTRIDQLNANLPGSAQGNQTHQNIDYFNGQISQLTPYGSTFALKFEDSNTNVLDRTSRNLVDPAYEQRTSIGVTQPLLKNFGPTVTEAGIRIAEFNRQGSRFELLAQVDTQIANAMKTYWDLVYAVENLSVQEIAMRQAEDLLRVNKVKFETGVLPQTDVLQAQASVDRAKALVINAQAAIITTQDRLKRLLYVAETSEEWNQLLVPEDLPKYDGPRTVLEDEALNQALLDRPELLAMKEYIKAADYRRDVASWQRLPELNAFGEIGVSGLGDTRGDAYNEMADNDYQDYAVGLEFKYPILNRRAKNEFARSGKLLEQAQTRLKDFEQGVTFEVRNAIRELRTGTQRVEATASAVRSEEAKLQAQLKRYEVGTATSFEVLTFQTDLADARSTYIAAVVEYKKSLIEFERSRARLRESLTDLGLPMQRLEVQLYDGTSAERNPAAVSHAAAAAPATDSSK